jgi:hypothetical protein
VPIHWPLFGGLRTYELGPKPKDSIRLRLRGAQPTGDELSCRLTPSDLQRGCSESIDPENVGDIADEGAGHRG